MVTLQNRYVLAIASLSAFPDYTKSVVYCEPGRAVINDSDAFFRIPSAAGSTWTKPAPSLPEALWQCRAAELDDRIFVVGECVSEFTTVRVAVFCPQMGVDKNNSLRLGGQWFLLSPESSPSWLSTNLVSHTGPQRYFEEFGTSLCFQPCSEEELENMKQEEEAVSEAVTNKTRESPVPEHSAASDNHDSAKRGKKDKPTTLPDSDPFSKWRWRPFCAPDKALDVCYAGVISVALSSGRQ
ncbi:unnamed protein product [Dibothriocephalus latus]|uniref:Uncharacterized protein n=1 Tax=Dibothriocephalus latus TaxID=60516 RepID=A0A3P7P0W0_DIBLA|nr:unnamed protein product [Dibothriocephalus latus]